MKKQNELEKSLTITASLLARIFTQGPPPPPPNTDKIIEATKIITQKKTEELTKKSLKIESNLDLNTKRVVIQAKEKGASS